MSLAEYGAYIRLLQRQWIEGSIPADAARLARLLRVTADQMDEIWQALSPKFVKDGRDRLKNRRLSTERDLAIAKVQKNRDNGKLGGRPKKPPDTDSETQKKPNGYIRGSGSGSVSGSDSLGGGDAFDRFWSGVPNQLNRGAARKAFAAAVKAGATPDEIIAGLPGYCAYEAKRAKQADYRPLHPATWLDGERWTDVVPAASSPGGSLASLTPEREDELYRLACDRWPDCKAQGRGSDYTRGCIAKLSKELSHA